MILIKVIFIFSPDNVEEAKAACVSTQKIVEIEEGCISFRFYQDLEDPTVFFLFEEWESQETLEAHWENNNKRASDPSAPKLPETLGEPIAVRYEIASYGGLRD